MHSTYGQQNVLTLSRKVDGYKPLEHGMVSNVTSGGGMGGYKKPGGVMEFPQEVQTCVAWLEAFCKYSDIPRAAGRVLTTSTPPTVHLLLLLRASV